jgi:hypothetical protein
MDQGDRMSSPLRAGVARRDITPPLGSPLMGYPNAERVATSVRDGLNVTALALEQDGRRGVILSFDLCVPDDDTVARLRAGIADRTGIPPLHTTVCYTQTHSGPNTQTAWGWCDRDNAYLGTMIPRAIDAAAEAVANLQPIQVGIGTTRSEVGINRRAIREDHSVALGTNPWGPYDPTMTVLRFESAPAQPLATLIHYGAHPTVFDGSTRAISRDWPGVMIDRVEHLSKAPAMFINGAVGDVAPRSNTMSAVGDGEAALQEVGTRAAMDAMRAFREVREFRGLDLGFLTGAFTLPYRPLAGLDEARRKVAEYEPRKSTYGAPRCEYLHWSAVVAEHQKAAAPAGKVYQQTITTLGPIALVPFPGEVFSETVLRLRQSSPYQHTLCASTSNGSNGYFPTRESLHRGGYEVWVAKAFGPRILAENIDDVLFEENLRLLRGAWDGANANVNAP